MGIEACGLDNVFPPDDIRYDSGTICNWITLYEYLDLPFWGNIYWGWQDISIAIPLYEFLMFGLCDIVHLLLKSSYIFHTWWW